MCLGVVVWGGKVGSGVRAQRGRQMQGIKRKGEAVRGKVRRGMNGVMESSSWL